jgi:hypothetical protein
MLLQDFTNPENFPDRVRQLPKVFLDFSKFEKDFLQKRKDGFSPSVSLQITYEQYVHALLQGYVVEYDENRGGASLNSPKIRDWFGESGEGIVIELLQEFPLGYNDDYEVLKLPSHHHRSALILYSYWMASEEIWKKLRKELLAIRVFDTGPEFERFVGLYCGFDDMTKQAVGGMLKNPQMVVGNIVSCRGGKLGPLLTEATREYMMGKTRLKIVASLIYAMEHKTKVCVNNRKSEVVNLLEDHPAIYACRGESKLGKHIKKPYKGNEDDFPVSDDTLLMVAEAIEDYMVFKSEFEKLIAAAKAVGVCTTPHERILSQISFLAYYLHDRCVFKKMPNNPKIIAERLFKGATSERDDLSSVVQLLWNGTTEQMRKRTQHLDTVLNRRPNK